MAAHGVAASVAGMRGNINVCCGRSRPLEMQSGGGTEVLRISGQGCYFPSRLVCSVDSSRTDRSVIITRQCFERSAGGGAPAKAGLTKNRYPKARATSSPRELEDFQARGWSEAACDEGALLKDGSSGLESLRARKAFASTGDSSETNMERLLEASVRDEGQSGEDYRRRAVQFDEVAEFFGQKFLSL